MRNTGAVDIPSTRLEDKPFKRGIRHCSICRRFLGAGYGTFFQVPRGRFRFLAGEAHIRRFRSSATVQRAFCGTCGSALFGEMEQFGIVSVTLASMLGPIDREPERHVCWDDRAPWVRIGDDLPRLAGPR